VAPAPSPQPASASAAATAATLAQIGLSAGTAQAQPFAVAVCTQTLASVRIACGADTLNVTAPAWVNVRLAVPFAPVVAEAPPPLTVAPTAFDGVPLASL